MRYFIAVFAFIFCSFTAISQIDFEVINGSTRICPGESAFLLIEAAEIDSVRWSPSNGLSSATSLSTTASPEFSTSYTVTLYQFNQTEQLTIDIDVIALDLGPDIEVCGLDGPVELIVGPEISPEATYTLTNNGGLNGAVLIDNLLSISTNVPADTYEIVVGVEECNLTDTLNIEIFSGMAPIVDYPEDTVYVCQGESELLTVGIVNGQTYSWTTGGVEIANLNSVTVTPLGVTTYYIEASNTSCDLSAIDSVVLVVNAPPFLNTPSSITVCENDLVTIGNNPTTSGIRYDWSPTEGITDPSAPNAELFVTQSTVLTLTASCLDPITVNVNMEANDLEFDVDTISICLGDDATLTPTIDPANAIVSWTSDDGVFSEANSPMVTVSPLDVTTYYATATSGTCEHTDSIVVQVDSLPFLGLSVSMSPVCEGDTAILFTTPLYEEYQFPNILSVWSPDDAQDYQTNDSLFQMYIIASETKEYVRVTTNGACSDTSRVELVVTPILEEEVMDETICVGESVTLNVEISQDGVPVDPDLLNWEWTGENLSEEDVANPIASPPASTTYGWMVDIEGRCPQMGMLNVTVITPPMISWPNVPICPGDSIQLQSSNVLPGSSIIWTADPADPTLSDDSGSLSAIVAPQVTTTYTVNIDDGICFQDFEESFTVTTIEDVSVVMDEVGRVCPGEELSFSANGTPAGGTYNWEIDGSFVSNEQSFSFAPFGDGIVSVSYTGAAGCSSESAEDNIDLFDLPSGPRLVTEPDSLNCNFATGDQIRFTFSTSSGQSLISDYVWTDVNGDVVGDNSASTLIDIASVPPTNQDVSINTYTLTYTTEDGCTSAISKQVTVSPASFNYPNIFAPASTDMGKNRFNIVLEGNIDVIDLRIYDRWGNEVYENDNNAVGWDGMVNGKMAPADVYLYIVTHQIPGQDPITHKGHLTLLR